MNKKKLAIIPARGGSKRIPMKNIKLFHGKPIISYSIDIAKKSKLFDDIIVSTDNERIAKISKEYGATVPFKRSKQNSNDYATLSDVIEEVKLELLNMNKSYDYICCLLPTAPLMNERNIKEGFNILINNNFDTVMTIVESYNNANEFVVNNNILRKIKRTVTKKNIYIDAGQFYWMHFDSALIKKNRKRGGIIIDQKFAQDINTTEDWDLAKIKYKKYLLNE